MNQEKIPTTYLVDSENVNDVYETFSKTILEGIQIENSID